MKRYLMIMSAIALAVCISAHAAETLDIPKPTSAQLAWQEAEIGALVCYELHTFNKGRYNQRKSWVTPVEDVNQFNPTKLDTDQWIKTLKDAGIGFALLTVSHESGFRLWQSDANPYCLKAVKWGDGKRDIFKEFVESCRKYGVKPGVYMGTRWNAHLGVLSFKVTDRSTITQKEFNNLIEKEVEEICSRYGELFEIWFDGGAYGPDKGGPDVLSIVEKYQKNIHFYHNHDRADSRWGGTETGTVPYPCWATMPFKAGGSDHAKEIAKKYGSYKFKRHGVPDGKYWCPAMSDVPLRGHGGHEWFWEPGDEKKILPLNSLVNKYYASVGRNSTLMIGVTPDTDGLMPEADAKRLKEFGDEMKRIFGTPLAQTSGKGNELVLDLDPKQASFDNIVIQEDIREGERVREYALDIMKDGKWQALEKGTCIGHKRIHKVPATSAEKLRLTVSKSIAEPIIKDISIYTSKK